MASVRGIAVLSVLALSSVLVVASATPAAAAITVTVDPNTGLADGQVVTITGTGFNPGVQVGAAECAAPVAQSLQTTDCDLSNSHILTADSAGTAVIKMRVRRTIVTANGTVDCVTAAKPCVIGAADITDLNDLSRSGGMALEFDPNAPPVPPPDVTLTPDNGNLLDRQQVAIYATGFIPGESVQAFECPAATPSIESGCMPSYQYYGSNYGTADPTGAVALGLTVRRALLTGDGRLDCAAAVGTCVVSVQAFGGPTGTAPLGFDPTVPLPPPPSLEVTPAVGLGDGQIVSVHGTGFTPTAPIALSQCTAGAVLNFNCFSGNTRSPVVDANGEFTTTFEVMRSVQEYVPTAPTPSVVDCAESPGRCVVSAFDYADPLDTATAKITFDPNKPPAPPPTATVSPSTGLVDGQTVNVSADGFPPGAYLYLVQCETGSTDASGCDISHLGNPISDDNGHVDATFDVHRFITLGYGAPPPTTPPGTATTVVGKVAQQSPAAQAFFATDAPPPPETVDCASAPGACTLAVAWTGGPTIKSAGVPLNFDASVVPSTDTTEPGAQPADGGDGGATSTSGVATTPAAQVEGNVVSRAPLARTGADLRSGLRLDLVLLVSGALALVFAAALRSRAHRRT